jgi:hypothetical protein
MLTALDHVAIPGHVFVAVISDSPQIPGLPYGLVQPSSVHVETEHVSMAVKERTFEKEEKGIYKSQQQ